MKITKNKIEQVGGFKLFGMLKKSGYEIDNDDKWNFINTIDDNIKPLYIIEKKEIKTNIFFRLTLPVLLTVIFLSLGIYWLFTGEWGFDKDNKYAQFISRWSDKTW